LLAYKIKNIGGIMGDFQDKINEIVRQFASMDTDTRMQWIAYFMECLDAEIGEDALQEINTILLERFENGQW